MTRWLPWRHALLALAALVAGAPTPADAASQCTCGFQDGQFTLSTMSIDGNSDANGDLSGWDSVKGDIDNNTCDAPSVSSPSELGGADGVADAPQNIGRDITWFSFTWDSSRLYFFTERLGSSNNIQRFLYYADANNDGLINQGERVIEVEWQGNTRLVSVYRHTYNAVNAGGDSITDSAGLADGYDMPGNLTRIDPGNAPLYSGVYGSVNGFSYEFSVSWADLNLAGPTAIRFHVAALNANITAQSPPNSLEDNLGGCGGGSGSSQFAAPDIAPNRTAAGQHGTLQCVAHTITNGGNGDDLFNVTATALPIQASSSAFYRDVDASGTLTGADTLMTDSASDADATMDTGLLTSGAVFNMLACYTIADDGNNYSPSGSGTVTLTATSTYEPLVSDSVTDTITVILVPDLIVVKSSTAYSDPVNGTVNPKRIPGGFVDYSITVTNDGGGAIDADTTIINEPLPPGTGLFVGDLGAPGSGPVSQTAGSPACGLAYTFTALASVTDDLSFSSDGGATFSYAPTPDVNSTDQNVTHLRINPKGIFAGKSAAGTPACTWRLRLRVD